MEMRLVSEIMRALGAEGDPAHIQYAVSDGKGGYFQNVRRLCEFSREKIVLQGKASGLTVEGRELSVKKYAAGDLVLLGAIESVKRTEGRP